MTSANLSLGLNTEPAKRELDDFKRELRSLVQDTKLHFSFTHDDVAAEIRKHLKGQFKAQVEVATDNITAEIKSAVAAGFAGSHTVKINEAALTAQIQAAYSKVGALAVQKPTLGTLASQIGSPSQVTIEPQLDPRAMMKTLVSSMSDSMGLFMEKQLPAVAARAAKLATANSATLSQTARDPNTGARVTVRRSVKAEGLEDAIQADNATQELAKSIVRGQAEVAAARRRVSEEARKQQQIDAAWAAQEKQSVQSLAGERARAFAARRTQVDQTSRDEAARARGFREAEAAQNQALKQELAGHAAAARARAAAEGIAAQADKAAQTRENTRRTRMASLTTKDTRYDALVAEESVSSIKRVVGKLTEARDLVARGLKGEAVRLLGTRVVQDLPQLETYVAKLATMRATAKSSADSVAQLQAAADRVKLRDVSFTASRASGTDISRLAGQLDTAAKAAEGLRRGLSNSKVIQTWGQEAYNAVPRLAAMREELAKLRAAAALGGVSSVNPIAEKRREIQRDYNSALSAARDSGKYTGTGNKIAGLQAVADKHGMGAASAFMKNDYLVSQLGLLDQHAAKTRKAHADTTAWRHGMADLHSVARGAAGSLGLLWTTFGSTVPLVAAAAWGATMRSVFSVGKDLEYQLTFVAQLADSNAPSLDRFGQAVRGSMVVPKDAAAALRGLAQNGLSLGQALQALPNVLNLATVGEMRLSDAALGATGVMAAFNLQVSDLGRIGDVFAKAAAISNTNVEGMVEAMKQASDVSDRFHLSLETTAAMLATLAKRNISGSAAGTSLKNFLQEIYSPTTQAKKAFESLGLSVYDTTTGRMKPAMQIIQEMGEKLTLLNEKGRTDFISEAFNERSRKTANAVIADYSLLIENQRVLKTEASGFADAMAEALGGTVQGKLQRLQAEFQLTTAAVFQTSKVGIGSFLDSIRIVVSSTEFMDFLKTSAKVLTDFTSFLIEHGKTMLWVGGIWASVRVSAGLVAGITAAATAMTAAQVGAAGMAVRFLALAPLLTSVGVLVAAAAAGFLIFRSRLTDTTLEQTALAAELRLTTEALNNQNKTLRDNVSHLERRNELLRQGRTAGQADAQLASEEAKKNETGLQAKLASSQKAQADAQKRLIGLKDSQSLLRYDPDKARRIRETEAEVEASKKTITEAETALRAHRERETLRSRQSQAAENSARLQLMTDFNARLAEVLKKDPSLAGKLKGVKIDEFEIQYGSREDAEKLKQSRLDRLDAVLGKYKSVRDKEDKVSSSGRGLANRVEKAETDSLVGEMERRRRAIEQDFDSRAKLESAKFDSKTYGEETPALLAEIRASEKSRQLAEFDFQWKKSLKARIAELNKPEQEPERLRLSEKLRDVEATLSASASDVSVEAQVLGYKAVAKARDSAREFEQLLAKMRGDSAAAVKAMDAKSASKGMTAEEQARLNAEYSVTERFASTLVKYEQDILTLKREQQDLEAAVEDLDGPAAARAVSVLLALRDRVQLKEKELSILQAAKRLQSSAEGDQAVTNYKAGTTAEAGWDRFWAEYRSQGADSANFVHTALKQSTDSMKRHLGDAAATGKFRMKDMVNAMLSDLARLAMNSLWDDLMTQIARSLGKKGTDKEGLGGASLLGTLFKSITGKREEGFDSVVKRLADVEIPGATKGQGLVAGGGTMSDNILAQMTKILGGSSSGGLLAGLLGKMGGGFSDMFGALLGGGGLGGLMGGIGGGLGGLFSLFGFANGGIMTPSGPLSLARFATGGVTHSPMLAYSGEGATPEAYVPLPDHRTIPVTLKGGTGKGAVSINFSPVVNIDSRSDQAAISAHVNNTLSSYNEQLMARLTEHGVI